MKCSVGEECMAAAIKVLISAWKAAEAAGLG